MNEFLRHNRDLFSSKREFLTKLREVRQKLMNKVSSPQDPTGGAIQPTAAEHRKQPSPASPPTTATAASESLTATADTF